MTNATGYVILAASLLTSCAALTPDCPCSSGGADRAKASGMPQQRAILAEGYSLLYGDLKNLDRAEWVLYVKEESDAVDELVSGVSDYAAKVRQDLERLSKAYPAVHIDLEPMPEMEKRKRASMMKERIKEYAPMTGKVGKSFERSLLGSLRSSLNQQAHLCKVMAETEPEPGLRDFLLDTQKGMDRQFERVDRFIQKRYGY